MRRIVPEMQAVLLGITNSNPSPETNVTYSDCWEDEEAIWADERVGFVTDQEAMEVQRGGGGENRVGFPRVGPCLSW